MVTQYYLPEMGAPQTRLSEWGEELISLGWAVEVLTALPNYPTGSIFEGYNPKKPVKEQIGRIDVVRCPLHPASEGFLNRLYCYFSFVRSCKRYGPALCRKPDVMFVESPPLFIGYAVRALKKHWHVPFVFNVSDLWPESVVRMQIIKEGFLSKMAEHLERSIYREAVAVTGQSDEIVNSIQRKCPEIRTCLISNGVDPSRFGPEKATDESRAFLRRRSNQTVFLYAGLFGLAQGLDQILDVASRVREDQAIQFVLIGDGPVRAHLEDRVRGESLTNVRLLPPQNREKIPTLLASADVAMVTLGVHIPGAVPSKIYEAMASAIPILLVADGEPARRVEEAGAGIAVGYNDIEALENAVYRLHRDKDLRLKMGRAGRHAATTRYNRKDIAAKLDMLLRDVIER